MKSGKIEPQTDIVMGQNNIIGIGANERAGTEILGKGSGVINFNSGMSVSEMQALIDAEGKYLGGSLVLNFADGTYNFGATWLRIEGFFGPGTLIIGDESAATSPARTTQTVIINYTGVNYPFRFINCTRVTLKAIRINMTVAYSAMYIRDCMSFILQAVHMSGSGTYPPVGVWAQFSNIFMTACSFDKGSSAIYADNGARISSSSNSVIGTTPTLYGLKADTGGIITKLNATQPIGATANEFTSGGGIIR